MRSVAHGFRGQYEITKGNAYIDIAAVLYKSAQDKEDGSLFCLL